MTHDRRVRDVGRESLVSALNVSSFIWGIADDVLRDVYVRGQPAAGGMVGSRGDGLGRGQRAPVQAARGRARMRGDRPQIQVRWDNRVGVPPHARGYRLG